MTSTSPSRSTRESRIATIDRVAAQIDLPLADYLALVERVDAGKRVVLPRVDLELSGCDLTNMTIPDGLVMTDVTLHGTRVRARFFARESGLLFRIKMTRTHDTRVGPIGGYVVGNVTLGKYVVGLSERLRSFLGATDDRIIRDPQYVEVLDGLSRGRQSFTAYVSMTKPPKPRPDYGPAPSWPKHGGGGATGVCADDGSEHSVEWAAARTFKGKWWALSSGEHFDHADPGYRHEKDALRAAKDQALNWLYDNNCPPPADEDEDADADEDT